MDKISYHSERYLTLPALRDLRAPDNRPDWPTHENVRVKPLGPVQPEVREYRIPSFLLVRS